MKKKISIILRFGISFGLLFFLFWKMKGDITGIWGVLAGCEPFYLGISALLLMCNILLLSYRLKIIFRGENLDINFRESSSLTVMGYFFNNFMPTAVGGDIIKAYIASIKNKQRLQSYASVMMDRFIGLYSFLVVAAVALFIDSGRVESPLVKPLVMALIGIGSAGFVIVINKRIAEFVERFFEKVKLLRIGEKINAVYSIVQDYRNRKKLVIEAFLVSLLSQIFFFLVIHMFFLSLDSPISIGNIFLIMPVVTFISMVPSLGGLGVREGAIVALFMPLAGKEVSFAVSLLLLSAFLCVSIVGGVIFLFSGNSKLRMPPGEEDVPEAV